MNEFFNSCWIWYTENRDNIIAFFTSTTFLGIVGAIFTIIKDVKSRNKNTNSIDNIAKALTSTTSIESNVSSIKELNEKLEENINGFQDKVTAVETKIADFEASVLCKVDAMMEVMSIVYSTIKDDTIRNSVSSVLVTAKHASNVTKAELEKQVDELKAEIADMMAMANAKISQTVDKVTTAVTGSTSKENQQNVTRY